jgi:hypothetical protein
MRHREFTIPTLLGLLITGIGLIAGVFLLRSPLRSLIRAAPEEIPRSVKITNISDNEFVVSWLTDKSTTGYVQYGENNPDLVISDDRDQEKGNIGSYSTHLVTVKNLKPSTSYSFKIGSGKGQYDDQGQAYQVKTGPQLGNPPAADIAYGRVTTAIGDPAEGALVYVRLTGTVPQATLVKSSGSWVIPLSTARTSDLSSFAPYDRENDKLEVFVEYGAEGSASTIVNTANDSPMADITLSVSGSTAETIPPLDISPDVPASESAVSKFPDSALSPAQESSAAASVVVLSPKFNEQINSAHPQILGKAPANSTVQIEIHSDQVIAGSVVTDPQGNWTYSVPENLTPGEHTITVSTIVNGVVQKVTRSFVVQAAGESNSPAFSATPSGTLAPTLRVSPTISPTILPSITKAPTATPTPAAETEYPQSGNLTPTLITAILGIGLIFIGMMFNLKFKKTISTNKN